MAKCLIKNFRHNGVWYKHEIDTSTDNVKLYRIGVGDSKNEELLTYTAQLRILNAEKKPIGTMTTSADGNWQFKSELYGNHKTKHQRLPDAEVEYSMIVLQKMSEEPALAVEN